MPFYWFAARKTWCWCRKKRFYWRKTAAFVVDIETDDFVVDIKVDDFVDVVAVVDDRPSFFKLRSFFSIDSERRLMKYENQT